MKICTQCKIEKDKLEFPKSKRNKDGLYSWCKECSKKKVKEFAEKNPESIRLSKEKRKEKARVKEKIYKKLNADRIRKQRKLHYEANAERIREKARKYSKNLTEEQKKRRRLYYLSWKKTESAKNYRKKAKELNKKKYPKILKASEKVQDALKSGKLIRATNCSLCNSEEKIEAHHADYDKPLDVIWVCKSCHRMIHKNLNKEKK